MTDTVIIDTSGLVLMNWFLYDIGLRHERVNGLINNESENLNLKKQFKKHPSRKVTFSKVLGFSLQLYLK